MDVSIISGDRDTLQLATEHIKIRIPKTKQGKTEVEDYYAADVQERIQSAMEQKIKDKRHRLSLYLERFHGLSPLRKLNQGYSYVSDKEGKTLTSVSQVKQGDSLLIYVTDGTIDGIYTQHTTHTHTLSIILLIEQRKDLNIPLPKMSHMILQTLFAIFHT